MLFSKTSDGVTDCRYDQLYDEPVFKCSYCHVFQKTLVCNDCMNDDCNDDVKLVVGGWSLGIPPKGKYKLKKYHRGYWKCFKHAGETVETDQEGLFDPVDYQRVDE